MLPSVSRKQPLPRNSKKMRLAKLLRLRTPLLPSRKRTRMPSLPQPRIVRPTLALLLSKSHVRSAHAVAVVANVVAVVVVAIAEIVAKVVAVVVTVDAATTTDSARTKMASSCRPMARTSLDAATTAVVGATGAISGVVAAATEVDAGVTAVAVPRQPMAVQLRVVPDRPQPEAMARCE